MTRRREVRRRTLALLPALLALLTALASGAGTAAADTVRDQQRWALDAIHAPEAWATTRGAGVTVAVLDTGVDAAHRDLAGSVLPGGDFMEHGARPGDPAWADHGTAMAGIIAGHGHGPDGEDGVVGVAPESGILPVRVLLEEEDPAREQDIPGSGNAVARGIRWAVDAGADVINLSLGDDSPSAHPDAEEDAAIRYALDQGVAVVASAGNGGQHGDPVSYPAGYPGVIAVTAVDRAGDRAPFSTRRWYATVSAPGKGVIIAAPDDRYMEGWGTSAAAAAVSGVVALVRAAHPQLTPAQIKRLLSDTAQRPPEGGRSDALGAGVVDAAAALAAGASYAASPAAAGAADRGPHTAEYFGPGPRPAAVRPVRTHWMAPAAALAGVLCLAAAVPLLSRLRPRAGRR